MARLIWDVDVRSNISQTIENEADFSKEKQDNVFRVIKAQLTRLKFDMKGVKNINQTDYAVQYSTAMNKDLAETPYVARTKSGSVETTIGEFMGKQVAATKEAATKSRRSSMRFGKVIRNRTKQLVSDLGYGYGMERSRDDDFNR